MRALALFSLLSSLLSVHALAAETASPKTVCSAYPFAMSALRVVTLEHLRGLLREVLAQHWGPELRGYRVELETFKSRADYMKSGVRPLTIVRRPRHRIYVVYVNERLLRDAPSDLALRAILVHETQHVVDYTRMSSWRFITWVAQYITQPQATYERQTDLAPLQKGLGCGLMEYRVWLYGRVDAKTRAQKERNYFTPAEIAAWMTAVRTSAPPAR